MSYSEEVQSKKFVFQICNTLACKTFRTIELVRD
jgi:hypothetical protein